MGKEAHCLVVSDFSQQGVSRPRVEKLMQMNATNHDLEFHSQACAAERVLLNQSRVLRASSQSERSVTIVPSPSATMHGSSVARPSVDVVHPT